MVAPAAFAVAVAVSLIAPPSQAVARIAPGFPGDSADWRPAGKSAFTTAYGLKTSPIWLTAQDGILSEVFYPDLSTPALRELDFAVLDGRGSAALVSRDASHRTSWAFTDAPIATHTSTAKDKTWRLTATYTVDASRTSVLADVTLTSLDRRPRTLVALADPALNNDGNDDIGTAHAPLRAPGSSTLR